MKAAVYRQNGGPEVLSYEDVPDPVPNSDEVLIRVDAISIEGGDLLGRLMLPLPSVPHIIGYGSAGEIVSVGSAVTGLRVGQRVSAFGPVGSHAELRVVRPELCWVLPEGFDAQAAPPARRLPSGPRTRRCSNSASSRAVTPSCFRGLPVVFRWRRCSLPRRQAPA